MRDAVDRRRVGLELTPKGERLLRSIRERRTAWLAERLEELEPEELRAIEGAIEPLLRAGGAARVSTLTFALGTRTFRSLRPSPQLPPLLRRARSSRSPGSWMQNVALAWLVLSLSRSPLAVATLLFCRFVPFTVLGLFAGSIVDRLNTRTARDLDAGRLDARLRRARRR